MILPKAHQSQVSVVLVLLFQCQRIALAIAVINGVLVALDIEMFYFIILPSQGNHAIAIGLEVVLSLLL